MAIEYGGRCPIWGTPATVYPPTDEWVVVDSPRAGGMYRLDIGYHAGGRGVQETVRARLTTWIVDQRRMGDQMPFATHEVILAAGSAAAMRTSAKMDRFFLALEGAKFDPIGSFRLFGTNDDEFRKWTALFGAWTEDPSPAGGLQVRPLLEDRKWIHQLGTGGTYRLTAEGVDQLERLTSGRTQFDQGFVAMWFGKELRPIYDNGFAVAIEESGYRPMRIDRKEHNNNIDDEMIAEIRRSRFLVADMTCPIVDIDGHPQPVARGGVYYEAGFAKGLGLEVIWTAREGMADHLHFDIRQYPHIMWSNAEDLREKLRARIGATLGYGPLLK